MTGTYASNIIAKDADTVIAIGTRLSDFTTSSKRLFANENVKFVTINNSRYHAYKMNAVKAVGDAKATVAVLAEKLRARGYVSAYNGEIEEAKRAWDKEMERTTDKRGGYHAEYGYSCMGYEVGFGCINNLEMNHGIGSFATEFRYTDGQKPCGDLIPVDYAKIAEGYGVKSSTGYRRNDLR